GPESALGSPAVEPRICPRPRPAFHFLFPCRSMGRSATGGEFPCGTNATGCKSLPKTWWLLSRPPTGRVCTERLSNGFQAKPKQWNGAIEYWQCFVVLGGIRESHRLLQSSHCIEPSAAWCLSVGHRRSLPKGPKIPASN